MRVFLALLLASVAAAAPILKTQDAIPGRYIIKLKDNADTAKVIAQTRVAGGKVSTQYAKVFKGFAAELSQGVLALISLLPSVDYVVEDGVARADAVGSWGLDRIDSRSGLDDTYNPALTGAGVDVYVIDTGVHDAHVDFGERAQQMFTASDLLPNTVDCNGHGTHCAGTVGSTTYGVAKGVKLIGVKVLGCGGSGSWSGIIEGIDWVTARATGPDGAVLSVASMSLGGGVNQAVNDAVNGMANAGVLVTVSAGNDNNNACFKSPASAVKAITVGSTTSTDQRSSFSNYGRCVDLFAPGSSITSTWIGPSNTATNTISGTSMSTPHVAGACALYTTESQLLAQATAGVVGDPGNESPNLLLYVQPRE